ncbi:hypothetical protein AAFF_G00044440 [Aldrovandia affinis]|uniref:Scaffolding anchor of CK1 domain-containing protein n=1 Tax=Aldrovandia affinis TaxID=143900 RepID=A0AAD7S4H0_9TELE|nr:hypothetical protein AAFF_G00044440 [Aldrovandia affinis]
MAGGDWSYHLRGRPSVDVYFPSDRSSTIKDLLRGYIRRATKMLAIVMDTFTDVEILCDILEATRKRSVSVYLLLDHVNLNLFVEMCENLQISSSHLTKMAIRSVQGETYCAKSGRKFTGQIKEKFIIIDCTQALTGSFSFTWMSWQVHRNLAVLFKGSGVKPFDLEFRRLYATSKPVSTFPAQTPPLDVDQPLGLRSPTQASQRRVHTPTCAPARHTLAPLAQCVFQRHTTVSQPFIHQRSFSSNYAARNLGRRLQNFYGGVNGQPDGQFLRPLTDFSFVNQQDAKPQ